MPALWRLMDVLQATNRQLEASFEEMLNNYVASIPQFKSFKIFIS